LIYTHREITYPIKVKELFQLTQLKYIVNKKFDCCSFCSEVSKKIPAKILALVGVKDPVTEQLKFPSGEVTIQHTADNFLGEGLIAYHYLILFMFPIEGENNKRWEKHFNNNFPRSSITPKIQGTAGLFKKSS
jgi:hypothetical protein